MLLSPRKNGLTSLFKEVRVFKAARVSFSCGCEGKFRGDSQVYIELLAVKGHFESDIGTR